MRRGGHHAHKKSGHRGERQEAYQQDWRPAPQKDGQWKDGTGLPSNVNELVSSGAPPFNHNGGSNEFEQVFDFNDMMVPAAQETRTREEPPQGRPRYGKSYRGGTRGSYRGGYGGAMHPPLNFRGSGGASSASGITPPASSKTAEWGAPPAATFEGWGGDQQYGWNGSTGGNWNQSGGGSGSGSASGAGQNNVVEFEFAQPTNSWTVYSLPSEPAEYATPPTASTNSAREFINSISSAPAFTPASSGSPYAAPFSGETQRQETEAPSIDKRGKGKRASKQLPDPNAPEFSMDVTQSQPQPPAPSKERERKGKPANQNADKDQKGNHAENGGPHGNRRRGSNDQLSTPGRHIQAQPMPPPQTPPQSGEAGRERGQRAPKTGKGGRGGGAQVVPDSGPSPVPSQASNASGPVDGGKHSLGPKPSQDNLRSRKGGNRPDGPNTPVSSGKGKGPESAPLDTAIKPPPMPPASSTPVKQRDRRDGPSSTPKNSLAPASSATPSTPAPESVLTPGRRKGGKDTAKEGGRNGFGGKGGRGDTTPGKVYGPNQGTPRKDGAGGEPGTPQGNWRQGTAQSPKSTIYENYIPLVEVEAGLQAKTLYSATLRINKRDPHEAYVTIDGFAEDILISGKVARNRAFDGDVVVVKILGGDERKKTMDRSDDRRSNRKREDDAKLKDMLAESGLEAEEEERELIGASEAEVVSKEYFLVSESRLFGKVVFILESRPNQMIIGTMMLESPHQRGGAPKPLKQGPVPAHTDRRNPFMVIPTECCPPEYLKDPSSYATHLWRATVKKWPAHVQSPYGIVHGNLGQMGEIGTETEALLAENGITWDGFSDEVLADLPAVPWSIPESELAKRRDFRDTVIFSVDPATARDLDDALSVVEKDDGNFEVGVHIADVSHFVEVGTALDKEALSRATTVYLVQKAIPMLPRLLCEELCSLNPGVDRLAFSVLFTMSPDGVVLSEPWFGRSVIRSCAKLSYDHAQCIIDDQNVEVEVEGNKLDQVKFGVKTLWRLSKQIRNRRFGEGGALQIHSDKLWFKLARDGSVLGTGVYKLMESNRMIEEFMLLANMAVAQKLATSLPTTALLRQHSPPKPKPMREFIELAATLGHVIDGSCSEALHQSLDAIEDSVEREAVRQLCIRPMMRAKYFCTGDLSVEMWRHYALNVGVYTHFTSPIRRYCDLVVHRMLDGVLSGKVEDLGIGKKEEDAEAEAHEKEEPGCDLTYARDEVGQIAKRCNDRKFSSKDAQDASMRLFLCCYLQLLSTRIHPTLTPANAAAEGIIVDALVYKIADRSYDVLIRKFGIEKRCWVDDMVSSGELRGGKFEKIGAGIMRLHWKRLHDDVYVEEITESAVEPSENAKVADIKEVSQVPGATSTTKKASGVAEVPDVAETDIVVEDLEVKEEDDEEGWEDEDDDPISVVQGTSVAAAAAESVNAALAQPEEENGAVDDKDDDDDKDEEGGKSSGRRRRKRPRTRRKKSSAVLAGGDGADDKNESSEAAGARSTAARKPKPPPAGSKAAILADPRLTRLQVIKVFDVVPVRVVVEMWKSPPEIKVFPAYPTREALTEEEEKAVVAMVEAEEQEKIANGVREAAAAFTSGARLGDDEGVFVSCPGLVEEAD
ncbi:DIS3-like exonuclease 2 [Phlyctochytrium planicorne]|nr:DIS3-like exonuclease 2 [Phlyctochytrium planicorne]